MLVEAMHVLRERGIDTTAAFLYGVPTPDTGPFLDEIADTIREFGLEDRVTINDRHLPLSQRDQYLKAAKAFVCVGKPGAENETGLRLRLRDSRIHGVPTIVDGFGLTGDIVAEDNLGIVLPEPSMDSLADAMELILSGKFEMPGRRVECAYETALVPFMEWLNAELGVRR
jgi:glycosyltransferase involved in cell wall biosynthesis